MPRDLLRRALANDAAVPLDAAALEIASIEYADLNPAAYLQKLDEIAESIGKRLSPQATVPDFLRAMAERLGRKLGFRGNEDDYYNVRNSCLNAVLDSRVGIPITLSVVYLEVARRLGRRLFGIGLPGHFVIGYSDEQWTFYMDAFHRGRFMTDHDCREMALDIAHVDIAGDPNALKPVSNAHILTRMLNNLRGVYFRAGHFEKSVQVLDLLIETGPPSPDLYKERAAARLQLRRLTLANADFQAYLQHWPDASDRADVVERMESIQRWLGTLN